MSFLSIGRSSGLAISVFSPRSRQIDGTDNQQRAIYQRREGIDVILGQLWGLQADIRSMHRVVEDVRLTRSISRVATITGSDLGLSTVDQVSTIASTEAINTTPTSFTSRV